MIHIKTDEDIKKMQFAGNILADVLNEVMDAIKPGVTELELDRLAEKRIRERGGEPGFQKVKGYHHTICTATNNVVVHGIPTEYAFQEGDIVCVDCGVFYKGFHTDMAETIVIPGGDEKKLEEKKKFLATGKKALAAGIQAAQGGNRVGDISSAIQNIIEKEGYSIVRSLVGHGVGRELHEEPEIPGYLVGSIKKTPILKKNMTIAVEIIYNMGKPDVVYKGSDDWTIQTKDGSLSGVFERTIAITDSEPMIITQ